MFCFQSPSQPPYGKALYSYEGKEPGDLKFNKGDVIILRHRVDEHWFHGELRGAHGFLPASHVQCLRPLPPAPPQGKALYDFEMKDRDQDQGCLAFSKVRRPQKGPCGTVTSNLSPAPAETCRPCWPPECGGNRATSPGVLPAGTSWHTACTWPGVTAAPGAGPLVT